MKRNVKNIVKTQNTENSKNLLYTWEIDTVDQR